MIEPWVGLSQDVTIKNAITTNAIIIVNIKSAKNVVTPITVENAIKDDAIITATIETTETMTITMDVVTPYVVEIDTITTFNVKFAKNVVTTDVVTPIQIAPTFQ